MQKRNERAGKGNRLPKENAALPLSHAEVQRESPAGAQTGKRCQEQSDSTDKLHVN